MRKANRIFLSAWAVIWLAAVALMLPWRVLLALLIMGMLLAVLFWWLMRLVDRPDPSQSEDYDLWQAPDKRGIPK